MSRKRKKPNGINERTYLNLEMIGKINATNIFIVHLDYYLIDGETANISRLNEMLKKIEDDDRLLDEFRDFIDFLVLKKYLKEQSAHTLVKLWARMRLT